MASTLTASTLTVTINESINLNGKNQGGTTTTTVSSIGEVFKRILTVPVSGSGTITLLETTGDDDTAVAAGKFIVGDMKYLRITNLNSTAGEGVKLQIARDDDSNGTDDECAWFLLEEGKSFILNTFDAAFDAAAGDLDSPTLDAITDIRALNESGSVAVDLEIFIASA
tara:strand:- start:6 stop:512 length:507 start_codon:yes stop_codon:yes gene_type:complete